MSTPRQELQKPGKLTPSRITDLLWETAVESFVRAILVLVMGSLALGLAGGLLKDMVPSLPPGLAPEAIAPEAQMHGGRHEWHYFQSHRLAIVFTLLFLVSASLRLAHYAPVEAVGRTTLRIRAVGRRLGDEWFGLIALNAIGAFVSTMVIFWVQRFSLPQMVYQSVLAIVGNYLEAIGQFLF